MILMCVLGSIHAFSVFLEPLEDLFAETRTAVSLTYSLSLVCLTVSVLICHHVFRRVSPVWVALGICVVAAGGCLLAAFATNLPQVWIGYSVLFGGANGFGYALSLQCSAQANPQWKGTAMGLVTASYAVGAILAPVPFNDLLVQYGFGGAMAGLAAVLGVIAPVVAFLLMRGCAVLEVDAAPNQTGETPRLHRPLLALLWVGYGTAVAAGLMAIGHATGIARAGGLSDTLVLLAPMVIAGANMIGSLLGGWLTDRLSVRVVLMAFPAVSSGALFLLALAGMGPVVLVGLGVVGFAYGAIIAVYPAAISRLFGVVGGVRAYGYVFTAWGTFGLLAPVLAGYLFEGSGNYTVPLIVAGAAGLVSLIVVRFMPLSVQEH